MADDEVRPASEPQSSGPATPNRSKRRSSPPLIEGVPLAASDEPVAPVDRPTNVFEPAEPVATTFPHATEVNPSTGETQAERAEDPTVQEPSMAAAAADLGTSEPVAEKPETSTGWPRDPEPSAPGLEDTQPPPPAGPRAGERSDWTPPPQRSSRWPAVLSLLGLLIVILLGAVLYSQYFPPSDDVLADMKSETELLKQRIAALEARPNAATAVQPLQDRLAALDKTAAQNKTDLADLRTKVEALPAPAAAPAPAETGAAAVPPPDLAPLQAKVADLDRGLSSLQEQVAKVPAPFDPAPLAAKIADLGQGLSAVQAAVAALPRVDLSPLDGRVTALDGKMTGLDGKLSALDKRLGPIEADLSAVKVAQQASEAKQEATANQTRAAPLAVTGQAIQQDMEAGRPYAAEVSALQALGGDPAKIKALQPLASTGAPTVAALRDEFDGLKDTIIGVSSPKPTGTLLDRVMANAQGLVKVRPAGAAPGDDPDAIVSRIDADLAHRDLKGALAEWAHLPPDGKAVSQAWADKVKGRAEADEAARGVVADAMTSLGAAR